MAARAEAELVRMDSLQQNHMLASNSQSKGSGQLVYKNSSTE